MNNKQEKQSERNRRYRLNNKEKIKHIQDSYYANNRDTRILNATNWRIKNKEKSLATRRSYMKTPKGRLNSIKASAKTRNIKYELSDDKALELLQKCCTYCGGVDSVGLDRLDSLIGYTESNSQPCCSLCNYMKRAYPEKMFIDQCIKIAHYHS